jgi:hypothetical protein
MNLVRTARTAIWAAVLISAAAYLYLVVQRVPYAVELDYIEGVMMDHIVRLAHGQPLYVEPTLDFIPLAYMPGFAFSSSLLVRLLGEELWVPRLLACGAMTLLALLVAVIVKRETRSLTLAAAGAGLLLGSFGATGGYYDVARPDSLMLLLAFSGLAILRFTTSVKGAWLSALVLTAAFFTKQHAVWFALAGLCHTYFTDRRRTAHFAGALLLGCGGGYLALSLWLGPWFSYFTWNEPSHWSTLDRGRIVDYLGYRLLGRYGVLMTLILLSVILPGRVWGGRSSLWVWTGLAGLATGLMASLDPHAFTHVMTPTVVALCVLGPITAKHVLDQLAALPGSQTALRSAAIWLLLFGQFAPLYYGVRGMEPHGGAAEARAALLEVVSALPGRVLVINHGDYTRRAGKGTGMQMIALDDIIRAKENRLLLRDPRFAERLLEPLRSGDDRPILISDEPLEEAGDQSNALWRDIAPGYKLLESLDGGITAGLEPVVGSRLSPRFVYVPRERWADVKPIRKPSALEAGG